MLLLYISSFHFVVAVVVVVVTAVAVVVVVVIDAKFFDSLDLKSRPELALNQ